MLLKTKSFLFIIFLLGATFTPYLGFTSQPVEAIWCANESDPSNVFWHSGDSCPGATAEPAGRTSTRSYGCLADPQIFVERDGDTAVIVSCRDEANALVNDVYPIAASVEGTGNYSQTTEVVVACKSGPPSVTYNSGYGGRVARLYCDETDNRIDLRSSEVTGSTVGTDVAGSAGNPSAAGPGAAPVVVDGPADDVELETETYCDGTPVDPAVFKIVTCDDENRLNTGALELTTDCARDVEGNITDGSNPILCRLIDVVNFLSAGVAIVATISVAIAGIQYTVSRGDPGKTAAAVNRLVQVGIAIFLYVFGWALLNWLIPGGVI